MNTVIQEKLTCLIFGEGGREKNFLYTLTEIQQFKYHTTKWSIEIDNASGGNAIEILKKCSERTATGYDLTICMIDIDIFKTQYGNKWEEKKTALEKLYPNISIFWSFDNLEDEFLKVIGTVSREGKAATNKRALSKINMFINKDIWNFIIEKIKKKESS